MTTDWLFVEKIAFKRITNNRPTFWKLSAYARVKHGDCGLLEKYSITKKLEMC